MKKIFFTVLIVFFCQSILVSQVTINIDGSTAHTSAMLDIQSSEKGFLLPRMTYAELQAITDPAEGLMVFCNNCGASGSGSLVIFSAGNWMILPTDCLPPVAPSEGIHIPGLTQIEWHWEEVASVEGYKWNTTNDPVLALNLGNVLTYIESELIPNSAFTRYVWAYNSCGNSTPVTLSGQTLPFSIGASYGGGIIFYIDGTGNHGLIAATTDQSANAPWGCTGTPIGGTSTEIGTGQANTTAIVNGCSEPGIAARLCTDLVLNGFDDWFLPSKDELTQLFTYKNVIGGFSIEYYFSSSECNSTQAWEKSFYYGDQACWSKSVPHYVRAIRAF